MLKLRIEREKRGWSQTRVAALTGIAASDVSLIERGLCTVFPGWRRAGRFGLDQISSEEFGRPLHEIVRNAEGLSVLS